MLLDQESRIDLDAPVEEYLEELRDTPCGSASLVDLAAHRAGLAAWVPISFVLGIVGMQILGELRIVFDYPNERVAFLASE